MVVPKAARGAALSPAELGENSGGGSAEDYFREAEEPCFGDEVLTDLPSHSAAPPTSCMLASDSPQAVRLESPSTSTTAQTSRRGTVNSDLGRKPWGCHYASRSQLQPDPVSKGPAAAVTETCRQVPGAAATTVEVGQIWNSMLRWMLRGPRSRLRGFLHSSLHKRVNEVNIPRTSRPVWPMPLPYGDMAGCSQSEVALRRFLNAAVLVMNWLHLGSPSRCPADFQLREPLTGEQRGVIARLRRLATAWRQCGPVTAADMGRSAGKVEKLEVMLTTVTSAAALLVDQGSGKNKAADYKVPKSDNMYQETVAKDIEADRLKFTGRPTFAPEDWLTEPAKTWYQQPLQCSLPPEESLETPPAVQVKGDRSEVMKLLRALDSSGRLAIFPASSVRMTHRAGMFALMKDLHVDRLILDSRPANQLEESLSSYTQTMASPVPLLDVVLRPGNVLRACEDLKDFYYFFLVSEERARRNSMAMTLSRAEASTFGCFPKNASSEQKFIPALNSMAMGDVNSVEYDQQSHFRLAQHLGLKTSDFLTLRGRTPRQDWAVGIVIDDLVIVEHMPAEQLSSSVAAGVADSVVAVYHQVGLKPNDKKRFRDELQSKFWGMFLDGESGLVQAQVEKVVPLAMLSSQVARLGWCNRKLLEMIAGAWTAALQFRKRGMCLLESIFADIQRCDYGVNFKMASETVDELWCLAVLAPLFVTDLRADVDRTLSLVDASDGWEAEVSTQLPQPLAGEMARQKLNKASWSRLLSPLQELNRIHERSSPEEEVPEGEEAVRQHPLWREVVRSNVFSLERKKRIRRRTHINISELSAALDSEARRSRACPSARLLLGSDSQVVLGALVRGRSSSSSLNARLRKALPTWLGFNTYLCPQYIHTRDNVADDPTRCRRCRDPDQKLPDWACTAVASWSG